MHRFIAAMIVCLVALASHPARAGVTGARVVSIGEMGKTSPVAGAQTDVTGGPGIRFGMELVPEGTPQGAPVVLEARLRRPGDPLDAPPMRWLVAARIGIPVLSVWEFAYDWEVEPGVWTMTVSHEDAVLATASFTVLQPDPQTQVQASSKPAETRQDRKAPEAAPAKAQASAQRPAPPRQEASPPAPAKQPEQAKSATPPPPRDRPAKPLDDGQSQGHTQSQAAPAPKAVASPPGKRVHVLVAGVYSEEARALWVAAFLQKRGVKACVRVEDRGGKNRWSLVAGWRDTPEEARRAKDELTPSVGEIVIVSMSASEFEKGLQCR